MKSEQSPTRRVQIRVSQAVYELLLEIADRNYRTVSNQVQLLIEAGLAAQAGQDDDIQKIIDLLKAEREQDK